MPRVIPDNSHVALAVIYGPDAFSLQLAGSMAIANNTFSPMAAGRHNPSTQPRGYTGDRGYGVNRFAGKLNHAVQNFVGATAPIADPKSRRLGFGAGTAGQPGLPNSGADAGGLGAIAYLGYGQLGQGNGMAV
jgi:hypothetical protein